MERTPSVLEIVSVDIPYWQVLTYGAICCTKSADERILSSVRVKSPVDSKRSSSTSNISRHKNQKQNTIN